MDSILDKALEFLGRLPTTPETREVPVAVVEEKEVLTPTRKYEVITEEDPLLAANKALKEAFPNLIFEEEDLEKVIAWIKTRDGVSLDIETHGHSKRKEDHKKEALSFVKGVIRLVQLSSGGEAFTLDAALLPAEGVAGVLGALRGKALYLHNAIFDLPRIFRHFSVDLLGEDVRDTQVLSRLYRSGQWEYADTKNGGSVAVTKKHNIGDVLFRELGVKIPKETDHRWSEPLTEARLRYASDDVEHLEALYHDLLSKVEEVGMMEAYEVIRSVYPVYMRQQARGVPFDAELYERMRARLKEKLEILDTQLR